MPETQTANAVSREKRPVYPADLLKQATKRRRSRWLSNALFLVSLSTCLACSAADSSGFENQAADIVGTQLLEPSDQNQHVREVYVERSELDIPARIDAALSDLPIDFPVLDRGADSQLAHALLILEAPSHPVAQKADKAGDECTHGRTPKERCIRVKLGNKVHEVSSVTLFWGGLAIGLLFSGAIPVTLQLLGTLIFALNQRRRNR